MELFNDTLSFFPTLSSELMIDALADSVGFVTTNFVTIMFPVFLGAAIYLTYFFGFRSGKMQFNFISMGLPLLGVIIFSIWYFEITAFSDGMREIGNWLYETFFF